MASPEGLINTPIEIDKIRFEAPVMVGAGPTKTVDQVEEVARSKSAAVVVGSITVEPRAGNPGDTYYQGIGEDRAYNYKGLPNGGLEFYKRYLPVLRDRSKDYGKPIIVSIAGETAWNYARVADSALEAKVDGIEINLGCPHVKDEEGQSKPPIAYDFDLVGEILRRVEMEIGTQAWVSVKGSPYLNPEELDEFTQIVSEFRSVKAVTASNVLPNVPVPLINGKPVIDSPDGTAGMSGKALKPINLEQVRMLKEMLPERISIIGSGGVSNPMDVLEYLNAGASAVQIVTAYLGFGPRIFERARGLL